MPRSISTTKLIILALLGFCALILGSAVLALQLKVLTLQQQLQSSSSSSSSSSNRNKSQRHRRNSLHQQLSSSFASAVDSSGLETIQSSKPTQIHLSKSFPPPDPTSFKTIGEAYWNQLVAFSLKEWDATVIPSTESLLMPSSHPPSSRVVIPFNTTSSSSLDASTHAGTGIPTASNIPAWDPVFALEQAAKAGNPEAQLYFANALASGIWPVDDIYAYNDDSDYNNQNGVYDEATIGSSRSGNTGQHMYRRHRTLQVTDEWIPINHRKQLYEAYLNWHMAAIGGNVEAAMALAFRKAEDGSSSTVSSVATTCQETLPYFEAAANGIMDQLEADLHSRGKLVPPMDKHILAQVHIHGGTSSQLDWHNKPDESEEALQFYHLKATTSWKNSQNAAGSNKQQRFNSGGSGEANNKEGVKKDGANDPPPTTSISANSNIDIHAAFTLGHLYQYGVRGVQQNLTLSLQYYEIAAAHGHWESAGQAGTMYFWGMGVQQDIEAAWDYFRIGAPVGLEGCRRKHENALKQQNQRNSFSNGDYDGEYETVVSECDDASVNGLGLIYLFGIKGKVQVDLKEAEKYFVLAKEMGNADAYYNLAMVWMGWKTHFKNVDDLDEGGMSHISNDPFVSGSGKAATATATTGSKNNGGRKGTNDVRSSSPPADYALHESKRTGTTFKGPLQSDVADALKLLAVAASKGHVQAKHRLGMIYSQGVRMQTAALSFDAIKADCSKAKSYYLWIIENAAPARSKRLRKAYKDYVAGDLESSLRNYLAAAETGSSVGQVNAAFLLERGTCLGLSPTDCAKASVRLWKAAATKGNAEACIRVGDFYYYGRLRGKSLPVGPFAWVQYFLYPEVYLPKLILDLSVFIQSKWQQYISNDGEQEHDSEKTCSAEGECNAYGDKESDGPDRYEEYERELVNADLAMAAHYYQVAVERHSSPRANFNLGFMHEWGLGIAQDFPLAKRHYDLANGKHSSEAELAVQIALFAMNVHELCVKWHVAFTDWWQGTNKNKEVPNIPAPMKGTPKVGAPTPAPAVVPKTELDIILSHLFTWSSFMILLLIYIVVVLYHARQRNRGQ